MFALPKRFYNKEISQTPHCNCAYLTTVVILLKLATSKKTSLNCSFIPDVQNKQIKYLIQNSSPNILIIDAHRVGWGGG
jgi:hypothetical protein